MPSHHADLSGIPRALLLRPPAGIAQRVMKKTVWQQALL
jgi:hypothetical protein